MSVQWSGPSWLRPWFEPWNPSIFHRIVRVDASDVRLPESVVQLSHLEQLSMHHYDISDRRLKKLDQLRRLQDLSLAGDTMTDDRLPLLRSLNQLRRLSLVETAVTVEAAQRFKADRPELQILMSSAAGLVKL